MFRDAKLREVTCIGLPPKELSQLRQHHLPSHGQVVLTLTPPGKRNNQKLDWLISDLYRALSKDFGGLRRIGQEGFDLIAAWMLATGVRELVVPEADSLRHEGWERLDG